MGVAFAWHFERRPLSPWSCRGAYAFMMHRLSRVAHEMQRLTRVESHGHCSPDSVPPAHKCKLQGGGHAHQAAALPPPAQLQHVGIFSSPPPPATRRVGACLGRAEGPLAASSAGAPGAHNDVTSTPPWHRRCEQRECQDAAHPPAAVAAACKQGRASRRPAGRLPSFRHTI